LEPVPPEVPAPETARSGLSVVILDRQIFPGTSVRGWITPPVVEELEIDLQEYSRGQFCRTSRVSHQPHSGREVETDYGRPSATGFAAASSMIFY